jgi:hypothetical protein
MPRFKANRWWAFVLALSLVLGSAVAVHAQSHGVASSAYVTNGDNGDGGGLNPPPIGDPDSPGDSGKNRYGVGKPLGTVQVPGRPVGDGRALSRVWTLWLGTLLNLTRIRLFGI